jgi:penicillin-binding protein
LKKKIYFIAFLCLCITALVSCSNQPTAEERVKEFVASWNKQDFKKMYTYLDEKSKNSIKEQDFVSKYENIYSGIETKNLKVSVKEEKDNRFKVTMKMDTMAGKLQWNETIKAVEEEQSKDQSWYVNWSPSLIVPDLKDKEKVRVSTIKAERGSITDRNGTPLAFNGTATQIGVISGELGNTNGAKEKLAAILNMSIEEIDKKLNQSWVKENLFVPLKTVSSTNEQIITKAKELQGVGTQNVPSRVYQCGESCAHLIGYVGDITAEMLEKKKDEGYTASSVIGKTGLESLYESKLRAKDGAVIYIADQDGNKRKELLKKNAENGQDIQLTIDSNVQESIYNQLKDGEGVGVALQPKTGEILALVSAPSYNPADFVLGISADEYEALSNNEHKPLLNRFKATFSPGSTFKLLTAGMLLENDVWSPDQKLAISGPWQKDKSWGSFHVNRVGSSPNVNLYDALVTSDNIYFAQGAVKLGPEKFLEGAKNYGFGEKLPLKGYDVSTSTISKDGKMESDLLLANTAYGQGEVQLNPIHLASIYTSIVNNGNMITPVLLKSEKSSQVWKEHVMSEKTTEEVRKGLIGVIEDTHGTARAAKIPGVTLAGKTGTAELKKSQGEQGAENGWFVMTDVDNPSLLVTMMVSNADGGSHSVVPKVKKVFEDYYASNPLQ